MLGLVNSIGAADNARHFVGSDRANRQQHGIAVPIPLAQREAKADSAKAVAPVDQDEMPDQVKGEPSQQPDSAAQAQQAEQSGMLVDLYA